MKLQEKNEARKLRSDGMSIKKIATKLNVSKSSVSLWVRDIILTDEQESLLRHCAVVNGKLSRNRARTRHQCYQELGRIRAREDNPLHRMGCMLYWAEGSKGSTSLRFTNTDPDMILLFVKFLRQCYNVLDSKLAITVNCFTDNGLTVDQIHNFWLGYLDLPNECLRKGTVDTYSKYSKKLRKGFYPYGTCNINVYDVKILHSIYGAIQEYIGTTKHEWE